MTSRAVTLLGFLLVGACSQPSWPDVPAGAEGEHALEARRLLADLRAGATDVHTIVWYGRRLAYLGELDAAIQVYGQGLRIHREEPHLLRHRGHRYLSVRDFEAARRDLTSAARYVADAPDEVELDGLPNDRGIPTSTLATNVYYHLGLAERWLGNDEAAMVAFFECVRRATTIDMEIAARYWLALCHFRLGDAEEAGVAARSYPRDADVIENHAYHALCQGIGGRRSFEEVASSVSGAPLGTLGYGLAAWALAEGRLEEGMSRLREVASKGAPTAFGTIAAEVDLARIEEGRGR